MTNVMREHCGRRAARGASPGPRAAFASVRSRAGRAGWRVSQRISAPAIRKSHHESPSGHSVARESRMAPATARSPSPISGQGRSRRLRSAAVAIESSLPSSGMTSAAASVDEDAGAAEQGEDDEADAEDGGVDLEVASQAPADAGKHAIGAAALQAADLGDMCCVFAHGFRMASRVRGDHPE